MRLDKKERILLRGSNLWYLGAGLFGPLIALFTEKIGGSVLDISYAWATFLCVTGIATILVGKYSDSPKIKERLLVLGYFFNAIFTFLLLFVDSPKELLLNQFGFGIALALATPTWQALFAAHENRSHPGFTWGLYSGEAVIIQGIAILIGGFVVKNASFGALFILMGAVQLVAALYMARILLVKKT